MSHFFIFTFLSTSLLGLSVSKEFASKFMFALLTAFAVILVSAQTMVDAGIQPKNTVETVENVSK